MSEPTPEPGGIVAHVEHWVQEHVAPELQSVKADAERIVKFAEAHAANARALADLVVKLVQAADPSAAPAVAALVAEAEKIAAEAARIARELPGGM